MPGDNAPGLVPEDDHAMVVAPTPAEQSWVATEPITLIGLIQGIALSVFALSKAFDWWTWSEMQEAIVLAETAALFAALTAFARAKVTPTARVALTNKEASIIDAAKSSAPPA